MKRQKENIVSILSSYIVSGMSRQRAYRINYTYCVYILNVFI